MSPLLNVLMCIGIPPRAPPVLIIYIQAVLPLVAIVDNGIDSEIMVVDRTNMWVSRFSLVGIPLVAKVTCVVKACDPGLVVGDSLWTCLAKCRLGRAYNLMDIGRLIPKWLKPRLGRSTNILCLLLAVRANMARLVVMIRLILIECPVIMLLRGVCNIVQSVRPAEMSNLVPTRPRCVLLDWQRPLEPLHVDPSITRWLTSAPQ